MVAVWRLIMRASADINDGAFPPHFRRDSLRDASHARTVRAVGSSFTVYKRANSEVTAIIMYVYCAVDFLTVCFCRFSQLFLRGVFAALTSVQHTLSR